MKTSNLFENLTFLLLVLIGISVSSLDSMAANAASPSESVILQLKNIHIKLTDGNAIQERMITSWMQDSNSGYLDLVNVIKASILCPRVGCKVKGPYIPLDVIEGWCRKNRGSADKVISDHTAKEVKDAYKMAWYEKNNHETRDLSLEQILRGE